MHYLYIGLLLFGLNSCGSSENTTTDQIEIVTDKPISPATKNIDTKPPSIPNI